MATKNYLSLEGLTQYDGLIKQYIGTEDAKSIKSLTVVGNTVSFFKTADASGTASYTVNLPDVSNFMELIASADGDKVVKSNSDGSVSESEISVDDLVTGYFTDSSEDGQVIIYDGVNGDIKASDIQLDDLATNAFVGTIPVGAEATTIVEYIDEAVDGLADEVITKISGASGDKVVKSNSDGTVSETEIDADDVVVKDDIENMLTGYWSSEPDVGDIMVYLGDPRGIATTDMSIDDVLTKISGASGDYFVKSNSDGTISETSIGINDLVSTDAFDELTDSLGTAATSDIATSPIAEQSLDDSLVSAAQVATFVAAEIAGLEGAMHFRGVITRQTGETDAQAIARVITSPEPGDVVVMADNAKEYIYESSAVGWKEVGDETEFVKKTTTIAGVDLQDNITKSELLTALNVEDGSEVNIVETVKVNGSALTPDANRAVNVTVAEGSANGTVSVNGSDVAVHGLGSAAYEDATAFDAAGDADAAETSAKSYTDAEIAKLDAVADGTKTAIDGSTARTKTDNDGIFALQGITEADGKLSAMTVVEVAQIGASNDAASKNTIYGAKKYADDATAAISTSDIENLFS